MPMGLSEPDLFALDKDVELPLFPCVPVSQKPYLSDTIDYDTDIAPHQFIRIYSGVGSGKNTFVNHSRTSCMNDWKSGFSKFEDFAKASSSRESPNSQKLKRFNDLKTK